ncbi:MAG: VCBS repeat-containing protein [Planctomycetota bacterium]
MSKIIRFRHDVLDPAPSGGRHDICLVGDLAGNGRNDIVIGAKQGDPNLFWYENPSWKRHSIATAPNLEAGGVLVDVTGNGCLDIVAGQQVGGHNLYWFEHPDDPRQPWPVYLIEDRFEKYHDQAAGDVDGDGETEIVVLSQKSRVLAYYDIPPDPRVSPWPCQCCRIVDDDFDGEGVLVTDIDGDGAAEILAGTNIYRPPTDKGGRWRREPFAVGYTKTRVAVGDLNQDGRLEIVLCEGESDDAKLAWIAQPDWVPTLLRRDLSHPHSLAVADFNGDGLPDIFLGEMGSAKNPKPRLFIYLNRGDGAFEEVLISEGISTHEAKAADLTGNGLPDIVGKPYAESGRIDVWWNETGRG